MCGAAGRNRRPETPPGPAMFGCLYPHRRLQGNKTRLFIGFMLTRCQARLSRAGERRVGQPFGLNGCASEAGKSSAIAIRLREMMTSTTMVAI